jgi:hypothetical protein
MAKSKESTEYDLLRLFVWEMESKGVTRNTIHLDVDEAAVQRMNERFNVSATLEQAQRFADKCLANEWLEHVFMGSGQYGSLSLTATGHGVVRSLQAKTAAKEKRSAMKKASDYVEDHKGLFVVIAAVIALAGVLTKLGGG